jgi:hypothetical protein
VDIRRNWIFIGPAAIVGIVLVTFLGGQIVMRLWNWLVPSLTGWHTLTFWQALGILVLCRILFGGLGMPGRARSNIRRRMAERWDNVPPEERERIRQAMRDRCGFGPKVGETPGQ